LTTLKKTTQKIFAVLASLLVSTVLCYFTFKGIKLSDVLPFLQKADSLHIGGVIVILVSAQILRSVRWGFMIQPLETVSQKVLFPITSIGFMFIVLLPARLGEIARPYILQQNSKINFSSAMATIVLERILDSIFILGLFASATSFMELPGWVMAASRYFALALLLGIGLLILGGLRRIRNDIHGIVQKIFPYRVSTWISEVIEKFYRGMIVLRNVRQTLIILTLTIAIWGMFFLVNWLLFHALGMNLGALASIFVLVFTILGIAVPAAPGFIGNYHFACILALSFFGVNKNIAVGYALLLHILTIGTILLLGLVCLSQSFARINMRRRKVLFQGDNLSR